MSAPSPRTRVEHEVALLVITEDPASTLRRIAALREIAAYRLVPGRTQNIRDSYFDTPDGMLSASRVSLRVRRIGRRAFVTLKTPTSSGGRGEYEAPLGAGIPVVAHRLLRFGLERPTGRPRNLRDLARAFGLTEVQKRTTRRVIRHVVKPRPPRTIVAELALDSVRYHFGKAYVCIDEVEIEAKGPRGTRAVATVAEALLEGFGGELRRWPLSKLTTGLMLEPAVRGGTLALRRDHRLTPRALRVISRVLEFVEG